MLGAELTRHLNYQPQTEIGVSLPSESPFKLFCKIEIVITLS